MTWLNIIHVGDCMTLMRQMIADGVKVQCIVTSPPYWRLRDYGIAGQFGSERTWLRHVARMRGVFRLCRELLADDGVLWLNYGDSYAGGGMGPGSGKQLTNVGANVPRKVAPADLPPKNLIGMPWRVAFTLQNDGWYLRQDIIWCLSGGAAVYARTQKGDMPIMVKDLVRLRPETVKLWNGQKWTQVLGWSRSTDTADALELELRSGERIGCTPGHQWPTRRGLLRANELQVGDVIDTTTLPEPSTPKEAAALGDDVAWLCGLYLAEGSLDGQTVQIAGHADQSAERLSRIEKIAAAFHGTVRVHVSGNSANICLDGPVIAAVIRAYIHGDSAHNKGLKVRAWQRSNAWLKSLFEGYLAGDGHYDVANDRWRLAFCRNDRLADDFRTLTARCGLSLRLAATTATGFGREWPTYRGDVRLIPTTHHNARVDGEIIAIRASRARQFWDIGVADEPHTFALASGVLTHNSKPNPMPESVRDRCTKAHEYLFLFAKRERYYWDFEAMQEPVSGTSAGGAKKSSIYGPKNAQTGGQSSSGLGMGLPDGVTTRNKRDVWTVQSMPFKEAHFATFPPALVKPCILAGSRAGDIIFDPFMGSGTTAEVASDLGRRFIGCELNPEYAAMFKKARSQQMGMAFV